MAEKNWPIKIEALKNLIDKVGSLWPLPSSKLSGYAEDGPYHCEDCIYLKRENGKPVGQGGYGSCNQPVMMADKEVRHNADGTAIVNIQKGCCEFVDPPKDNGMKKHHKYTHTTIEHHDDGSHTITHHHEDGKSHVKYSRGHHDAMMDGIMDHTSAPNPGEAEAEAGPATAAPAAGAAPMAAPAGA